MDEQAIAQMVNERIAQQIGQLVIANTQAGVRSTANYERIQELEAQVAQLEGQNVGLRAQIGQEHGDEVKDQPPTV